MRISPDRSDIRTVQELLGHHDVKTTAKGNDESPAPTDRAPTSAANSKSSAKLPEAVPEAGPPLGFKVWTLTEIQGRFGRKPVEGEARERQPGAAMIRGRDGGPSPSGKDCGEQPASLCSAATEGIALPAASKCRCVRRRTMWRSRLTRLLRQLMARVQVLRLRIPART